MALTLRLQRHGSPKRSFFHIVATDSREARNSGNFIEKLGYYDPHTTPSVMKLDTERCQYWYENGATVSDAVKTILRQQKIELKRPKGVKSMKKAKKA